MCAREAESQVKHIIYILLGIGIAACTKQDDVLAPYQNETVSTIESAVEDIRTFEDLEVYLRNRYGEIQPLPAIWEATSSNIDESGKGPYRFRLRDGSEISIDGIYTQETGPIIDPNFDFSTLPKLEVE